MQSNEGVTQDSPEKIIEYYPLGNSADFSFASELVGVLQLFLATVILAIIMLLATAFMLRGDTDGFGFLGYMTTIFTISVVIPIIFAIIIILIKWRTGDLLWRENMHSLFIWAGLIALLRFVLYVG